MARDSILKNATDEELANAVEEMCSLRAKWNIIRNSSLDLKTRADPSAVTFGDQMDIKNKNPRRSSRIFHKNLNYAFFPSISKPGIREALSSHRKTASNK